MISYQLSPFHKKKEPIVISKADRAERIFKKKDGERTENAMENLKPCPFCGAMMKNEEGGND